MLQVLVLYFFSFIPVIVFGRIFKIITSLDQFNVNVFDLKKTSHYYLTSRYGLKFISWLVNRLYGMSTISMN